MTVIHQRQLQLGGWGQYCEQQQQQQTKNVQYGIGQIRFRESGHSESHTTRSKKQALHSST